MDLSQRRISHTCRFSRDELRDRPLQEHLLGRLVPRAVDVRPSAQRQRLQVREVLGGPKFRRGVLQRSLRTSSEELRQVVFLDTSFFETSPQVPSQFEVSSAVMRTIFFFDFPDILAMSFKVYLHHAPFF